MENKSHVPNHQPGLFCLDVFSLQVEQTNVPGIAGVPADPWGVGWKYPNVGRVSQVSPL
jgi:hypothetical protein